MFLATSWVALLWSTIFRETTPSTEFHCNTWWDSNHKNKMIANSVHWDSIYFQKSRNALIVMLTNTFYRHKDEKKKALPTIHHTHGDCKRPKVRIFETEGVPFQRDCDSPSIWGASVGDVTCLSIPAIADKPHPLSTSYEASWSSSEQVACP